MAETKTYGVIVGLYHIQNLDQHLNFAGLFSAKLQINIKLQYYSR